MLLPFDWTILTLEDAQTLKNFIGLSIDNSSVAVDEKILRIYMDLKKFIQKSDHYYNHLKYFEA